MRRREKRLTELRTIRCLASGIRHRAIPFTFAFLLFFTLASLCGAHTNRVYFIGNSVTATIRQEQLAQLAASRGHQMTWGRHIIYGAPLQYIWDNPTNGFWQEPFGTPTNALSYYQWDALSIQPFDRLLPSDTNYASLFINAGMPHNSNMQVYIYSRWPRQSNFSPTYSGTWNKIYYGSSGLYLETRDYFQKVVLALRREWTNRLAKPILLVPVGDTMYNLDQKINAGQIPGFTSIRQLYADDIHLNDTGAYVVACVYYSTVFAESCEGLPSAPYNLDAGTPIVGIIQTTAWDTVLFHPYSGVIPEPASVLVLLAAAVACRR